MIIRDATKDDLAALLALHNYAVRELDATWTEIEDTLAQRTQWFAERTHSGFPVLVVEDEAGQVVGFGTFGPYRARDGYRLTVEHSVYIDANAQGKGIGKMLMVRLIDIARAQGRHIMMAIIEDKNTASVHLHESLGFVLLGHLPQAGIKHGRWLGQFQMYLQLDTREIPPVS